MRGRNAIDTEHVKAGAYHTLEIEPQRPFEIHKFSWDVLDLDRLKQACDPRCFSRLGSCPHNGESNLILTLAGNTLLSKLLFGDFLRHPYMATISKIRYNMKRHAS